MGDKEQLLVGSTDGHGQARHVWLQDGRRRDGQAPGDAGPCPGSQLCPAVQQVQSVPMGCGLIPALRSPNRAGGSKGNFWR